MVSLFHSSNLSRWFHRSMNLMFLESRASSSSSSSSSSNIFNLNPNLHLQCLRRSTATTTTIIGSTARFLSSRVPTSPISDPGTGPTRSELYRIVSGSSRREAAPRSAGTPARSLSAACAATPAAAARVFTLAFPAPPCTATRLLAEVRRTRRRTRSRREVATRSPSTSIAPSSSVAHAAIRSTIATSTPRWSSLRPPRRRSTRRLTPSQRRPRSDYLSLKT